MITNRKSPSVTISFIIKILSERMQKDSLMVIQYHGDEVVYHNIVSFFGVEIKFPFSDFFFSLSPSI